MSGLVIIDYGMGNLFSIQRAVQKLGGDSFVSGDVDVVAQADKLILPGVGAFGDAMRQLKDKQLVEPILEHARSEKPLLGICLGMQLLLSESDEFGVNQGLGIIPGRVELMFQAPKGYTPFKLPHIGWNKLHAPHDGGWQGTVFENVPEGAFAYFVHSFAAKPEAKKHVLSETIYGTTRFCSAVHSGQTSGCQFHPELSDAHGLSIIKYFLAS